VRVHALEPSAFTYGRLVQEAPAWAGDRLVAVNAAASDSPGRARFHTVAQGAGSNSFHPDPSWQQAGREVVEEEVEVVTVDGYCEGAGIDRLALLKSDAEGHDMQVLRGARGLLGGGRVDLVQFEYNHRWVGARAYLRDAFDYFEPLGYHLGKVTPRGVEWYDGWDPELETFREANFLASPNPADLALPPVRWWKTRD
jgi:FkbM family methyltransferase